MDRGRNRRGDRASNVLWQLLHGFPFLEVMRNDSAGNLTGTPAQFLTDQFVALNVVLFTIIRTGIVAPFVSARLAEFRFLAIAFVVSALLVYATARKELLSRRRVSDVVRARRRGLHGLPKAVVAIWATLAAANGVLALPFVLPLYPPDGSSTSSNDSGFKERPEEVATIGAPLTQIFSYEFGWEELTNQVGELYASLPADDRAKAAIFATRYGEAAAIDVLGPEPSAGAQRKQPVLFLGAAWLRRVGRDCGQRRPRAMVAVVRFGARRRKLWHFAVRDAARAGPTDRSLSRHASAAPATLAALEVLRNLAP